jgi:hypothetical protein
VGAAGAGDVGERMPGSQVPAFDGLRAAHVVAGAASPAAPPGAPHRGERIADADDPGPDSLAGRLVEIQQGEVAGHGRRGEAGHVCDGRPVVGLGQAAESFDFLDHVSRIRFRARWLS